MFHGKCVLIVDRSAENREVLRTALGRRGTRIFEAARAQQGLQVLAEHAVDLVVFDVDAADEETDDRGEGFRQAIDACHIPLVILGGPRHQRSELPTGEFVTKPYHYGPLLRKIEGLLNQARLSSAA